MIAIVAPIATAGGRRTRSEVPEKELPDEEDSPIPIVTTSATFLNDLAIFCRLDRIAVNTLRYWSAMFSGSTKVEEREEGGEKTMRGGLRERKREHRVRERVGIKEGRNGMDAGYGEEGRRIRAELVTVPQLFLNL